MISITKSSLPEVKVLLSSGFRFKVIIMRSFFAPELDKHGYQALYKRKTNEVSLELLILLLLHLSTVLCILNSCHNCRFTMEILILLMVVQHFFAEIGFLMSKNTRFGSVL